MEDQFTKPVHQMSPDEIGMRKREVIAAVTDAVNKDNCVLAILEEREGQNRVLAHKATDFFIAHGIAGIIRSRPITAIYVSKLLEGENVRLEKAPEVGSMQ
ncbi:hypothetical protein [Methylobacterium sp. 1030]|uniref:hypothetical protein n=1 Tax=Methylobacterium sp. 1030 TaxID=3156404 RepID=UPI00339A800E